MIKPPGEPKTPSNYASPFQGERFRAIDPMKFARECWPGVRFYKKQVEIIEAVEHVPEVFVHAGNMLGKDFVAGYIALSHFLRYPSVRVITTSVKDDHLRVLWSEIDRFVKTCRYPLAASSGGCLFLNHRDIRKKYRGIKEPISYMRGMVSEKGEGMAGHHASHTLAILDEGSGIDELVYTQVQTWAKRILVIGNPMSTNGFFYKVCKGGDIIAT